MEHSQLFMEMLLGDKYFTSKELMYEAKPGLHISPHEYKQFVSYKDSIEGELSNYVHKINLKTFNNFGVFYVSSTELLSIENSYYRLIIEDNEQTHSMLSIRNMDDITLSRIYSEVEGTLNIESVPTTRKAVAEIAMNKRDPKNQNEHIIQNMINGIIFLNGCPKFNETNLYTLYGILSKDCLSDDYKLLDGNIYRHDGVEIGGYNGCPFSQIKECMDSLFEFVNNNLKNQELIYYLPHIAHYYILYIHPYFDYNGRTARMVSYWISLLVNNKVFPQVISEAINQTKAQYYNAITETRDAHNDLTYFLLYVYKISIKYFLTYKNIEEIDQELKNKSVVLTNVEKAYIKKILISSKGKFTHSDFTKWVDVNMTKQGALKILNSFCSYGVLVSTTSKSNNKLFEINSKMIKYVPNIK